MNEHLHFSGVVKVPYGEGENENGQDREADNRGAGVRLPLSGFFVHGSSN